MSIYDNCKVLTYIADITGLFHFCGEWSKSIGFFYNLVNFCMFIGNSNSDSFVRGDIFISDQLNVILYKHVKLKRIKLFLAQDDKFGVCII